MPMTTPNVTSPKDLPVLRRGATVKRDNGHVVLQHLAEEVVLEGAAAQLFTKVQPALDGQTAIDAIATKVSEPPKRLRALVDALDKAGVVAFQSTRNDGALMTGLEFYELHKERSNFWLRDVYAHPFWEKV